MNEITILSGKGGTGKTSISAAFATIATNKVLADCDVDAANLHLILQPRNSHEEAYTSGHKAIIDYNQCSQCGICMDHCRFGAISIQDGQMTIAETSCDGCMLCSRICPQQAITMVPNNKSRWYLGDTRFGKMVHARLAPGEENSGKLVNVVRDQAKALAKQESVETIIIDGPPGTGCPVISSLTGVKKAVIVTEPTNSGFHDMKRIIELTANFKVKTYLIINKWDLNPLISQKIETWAEQAGIPVVGKLPFDRQVVDAMVQCKSICEYDPDSQISKEIEKIWETVNSDKL